MQIACCLIQPQGVVEHTRFQYEGLCIYSF